MTAAYHGYPLVRVGGFNTVAATRAQLAQIMVKDCLAARTTKADPKLVFSSNGQGIALAGEDPNFADAMDGADIIHADGMSVVNASRLLTRTPLPERAATTDFFHDAAEAAQAAGLKFFILGGKEDQNLAATEAMQRLYPDLQIVGRRNGYFSSEQDAEVCQAIVDSGADVLWVGLGKPKQEFWSVANRERLRGVGWIKTCGGLYSYLAGDAPRAPVWVQKAGLEWLFRTLLEPRRLGVRYLITNPHSIYRMVRYSG
ncbi:WecB/TagA/CpsF family glycosyltransferase [Caulobacter sp. SL161]|uniref:WecB/TagA/CpsF family glycosyltransferase n=1 Tax=Caulobacter sp. SL161 TaxID=2995156 RepID=UPI002275FB9C|nr:WecB/TagA/CpsF family glycosyltransferase [Caulobacter sp. SL161]MCY1648416.1 WecB/TagA/CpsF family glycosyltransferase [Caulobacter sp. SL161]